MKFKDNSNKPIKVFGFADTETMHEGDYRAQGIDVRVVGKELHVFENGEDTGRRPVTSIKCACLIVSRRDGTREEIKYLDTVELLLRSILDNRVERLYFHNVKFDMSFIIDRIMRGGQRLAKGWYLGIGDGWRVYFDGERDVIAGGMGAVYKFTLHFQGKRDANGNYPHWKTEVCDSAKIWAGTLDKLGKDFGILKGATTGGSQAQRVGADDVLREYCMQDCRVLEYIMWWYFRKVEELTNGERPNGYLTAASTAINLGLRFLNEELREKHPEWDVGMANKRIEMYFPKLDTSDNEQSVKDENGHVVRDEKGRIITHVVDKEKAVWKTDENGKRVKTDRVVKTSGVSRHAWIRDAYKGATPLLDRKKMAGKGYVSVKGHIRDVNSMHPTQLVKKPMPCGKPLETVNGRSTVDLLNKGELPTGYTYVGIFRILAHVKKGHRATIIQKKGKCIGDDEEEAKCLDSLDGEYTMCQPEVDLLYQDYDVYEMECTKGVAFHARTGIFDKFLMYWYDVKQKAGKKGTDDYNPGLKAFAKLIINSFYGKFGTNPFKEELGYELDDVLKKKEIDIGTDMDMDFYLPLAIWTTAYSRKMLSDMCNAVGWENVIYTDTDSIHVENLSEEEISARLEAIGIGSTDALGDAKPDGDWEKGLYIRNKGYCHFKEDGTIAYENGKKDIKMGGANGFDNINCIDDVMKGAKATRLTAYSCIGGIILWDTEVKVQDEGLTKRNIRRKVDKV